MCGGGIAVNNHSDPTANQAIGAVNREWCRMLALAIRIRQNPQLMIPETEREFTGIYRRLLTDPLDELIRESPRGKRKG